MSLGLMRESCYPAFRFGHLRHGVRHALTAEPATLYPGQPDKMPTREELLDKSRSSFGQYHFGLHRQVILHGYAAVNLRARLSIEEYTVEAINLSFSDLLAQVQDDMITVVVQAVDIQARNNAAQCVKKGSTHAF